MLWFLVILALFAVAFPGFVVPLLRFVFMLVGAIIGLFVAICLFFAVAGPR